MTLILTKWIPASRMQRNLFLSLSDQNLFFKSNVTDAR